MGEVHLDSHLEDMVEAPLVQVQVASLAGILSASHLVDIQLEVPLVQVLVGTPVEEILAFLLEDTQVEVHLAKSQVDFQVEDILMMIQVKISMVDIPVVSHPEVILLDLAHLVEDILMMTL